VTGDATWRVALTDWVTAARPNPAGTVAACGSLGGDAVVVDLATGDVVAKLADHHLGVLAATWSQAGDLLAISGQDGHVRIYDQHGGERAVIDLGAWVPAAAWSPDGRWLAVAAGRRLHLLDTDGVSPAAFDEERSTITAVAWSVDGRRVGVAAYGGIRWYEPDRLPDVSPARDLTWKGSLLSLAVSPNGRWVCAGAQDQSIHLWRLWSGGDLQMSGYPSKVEQLAFRDDGRWMASACLSELTVWDFGGKGPAGSAPAYGTAHERHITALAWEPGGDRLATAGADGRIAIWPSPRKAATPIDPLDVIEDPTSASSVAWLPTGAGVLIGRADGTIESRPC
jgi:WD40 repeat protein